MISSTNRNKKYFCKGRNLPYLEGIPKTAVEEVRLDFPNSDAEEKKHWLQFVWLRGPCFNCLKITPELIYLQQNKMEDIECVFESVSGRGSLFISNYAAAQNLKLLQSKGIKAIVSAARSGLVAHSKDEIQHYLFIPAEDHEEYPLCKYFDQTYDFIEKARKESNVLVHCMAGISRSVTIVIAYLLRKYKYTLGQVITMIQRRRRKINPNPGFIQQLKKYCEHQGIKCDFQGNYVPHVRENSNSKQIHSYSAKKDVRVLKRDDPPSPLLKIEKASVKQRVSEKLIAYNEDIVDPIEKPCKLEQKVVIFSQQSPKLCERQTLNQKTFVNIEEPLNLKKAISLEESCVEKRRASIEKKISKIREKLIKSDQISRKTVGKSIQGIFTENKQNKSVLKREDTAQKSQKKRQEEVRTSCSKRSSEKLKPAAKKTQSGLSQKQLCPEDSSDIFASDFKLQSRTFLNYPRLNFKMSSRRDEIKN